jgi:hypothetical protein
MAMAEIPAYAFAPLKRVLNSTLILNELLHLSIDGLGMISNRPRMVEASIKWDRALNNALDRELKEEVAKRWEADLQKANSDAAFTNKECDEEYPLLHAFFLVGAWAALEAGVEDMLVGILVSEPIALVSDVFAKIRVPLSKYEQLDKEERMRLLLSELQRANASGLAQGVNAFERALDAFALSGPVQDTLRDTLWNLNNIRNVIVHRDSRADSRFVENCPSLGFTLGERILVNHKTYSELTREIDHYVIVLMRRLCKRYDAPLPESLGKWANEVFPEETAN